MHALVSKKKKKIKGTQNIVWPTGLERFCCHQDFHIDLRTKANTQATVGGILKKCYSKAIDLFRIHSLNTVLMAATLIQGPTLWSAKAVGNIFCWG